MTHHDPQMEPHSSTGATHDPRGSTPSPLAHLSQMDDYEIADGEPDIRGWDIRSMDGRKIGEVDDLLVDTATLKVRYVEMKLDDDLVSDDDHRHFVVPIGTARLDVDEDEVLVNLRADDLRAFPPYRRGEFSREDENALMQRLSKSTEGTSTTHLDVGGDLYGQPHFDDRLPFAGRREKRGRTDDGWEYITRSK